MVRHAAGYHRWLNPETVAPGRAKSVCTECGLVIEHQDTKRPGQAAAGRVIDGRRLTSLEQIPTCGDAPRKTYDRRHTWELVGPGSPSPRGARCNQWRCSRCELVIETVVSCFPCTQGKYTWMRYLTRESGEWSLDRQVPRCVDVFEDDVKAFASAKMADMTVRSMAQAMGVSSNVVRLRVKRLKSEGKRGTRKYHRWSEEDDAKLAIEWRPTDIRQTAKALGRSVFATMFRARAMGLIDHRGCPQGYEYLSDAVDRLGFSEAELKRMVANAGLKRYKALTIYGTRIKRTYLYDAEKLTDMVDAWLETARVGDFARENGLMEITLRRWLRYRGIEKPSKVATQSWRQPIELLEDVLREIRELWSCNRYATERGMSVGVVVRRARMLGYGPRRHFDPAIMDDSFRKDPIRRRSK